MKRLISLSGAALLAVVAGMATAQPIPAPAPARPDRNADVTRQQVIERVDQRFVGLDADRDGRFTPEEGQALRQQRRAALQTRMFDRVDADRDGSISREEFAQGQAMRGGRGHGRRGGRMAMMGPPPGGPGAPPPPGAEGPPPPGGPGMRGARLFGEQGYITLAQMRERALARFDAADANHDGTLTAAERRSARAQMRDRFGGRHRRG